ncbi:clarin-3 [Pangasianodon hypophthalmus]|uniref:clarin-3 n=1 Tax=Pangasianodon hypophthalmus TaxID=310915 RepID=UPI000EFDEC02|nr:clarin-3 [Pangasianodon hypophthalmus]
MPSAEKILYFLPSALLNVIGVAILGYGISAEWASSTMDCSPADTNWFNGTATIQMGLFAGTELKDSCPRFTTSEKSIAVFDSMSAVGGAGIGLHAVVVVLLVFALVASAGSIFITLYNTITNPYETCMGPIGLYVCSGLSACLAFLAMVLYLINLLGVNIGKKILLSNLNGVLMDETVTFLVGFFMILPYITVNLLAILLVYLYAHAAYRQRQEQQKPTEDAPKEILMY